MSKIYMTQDRQGSRAATIATWQCDDCGWMHYRSKESEAKCKNCGTTWRFVPVTNVKDAAP